MSLLALLIGVVAMAGVVAIAELARTVFARIGKLSVERRLGIMKLPGNTGCTGARAAVILVGPCGAYVGVAILAFSLFTCHGLAGPRGWYSVDEVLRGFDAVDKLEPGDRILELDGRPLTLDGRTLQERINDRGGAAVTLVVERAGARRSFTIQPKADDHTWRLGIRIGRQHERTTDFGPVVRAAIEYPAAQAKAIVSQLIPDREEFDSGGPIRIIDEMRVAPDPFGVSSMQLAMYFATYALLGIILIDLVRLGLLLMRRRP